MYRIRLLPMCISLCFLPFVISMCCIQGEKFLCEADYLKSVQAVQFQFVAPNAAAVVQQQGADSSTLGEWSMDHCSYVRVYGVHVLSSLQYRHGSPGHTLSMVISVCVHTYVCISYLFHYMLLGNLLLLA